MIDPREDHEYVGPVRAKEELERGSLEGGHLSMQDQFGSQVTHRESDTGDDDGEQTMVDNHIGPSAPKRCCQTPAVAGRVLKGSGTCI